MKYCCAAGTPWPINPVRKHVLYMKHFAIVMQKWSFRLILKHITTIISCISLMHGWL